MFSIDSGEEPTTVNIEQDVSMENTKKEIQEHLTGLGIDFKETETKQQLLDKLM